MRFPRRLAALRAPAPSVAHLCVPRGSASGRVLLSYLREPVLWVDSDPRFAGHTNRWECWRIARTLVELGFDVDAVDFDDDAAAVDGSYDVVIGLDAELVRYVGDTGAERRLLHLTGSFAPFNNAAEERRIDELAARRGVRCAPRRVVPDPRGAADALALADRCSLVGNAWVIDTYPAAQREKITCVPVTGSQLSPAVRERDLVPPTREFVWFFGGGAVHKGLDLALEAFARRPELVLHVVGDLRGEDDFLTAYRHELTELANVHVHGFLTPDSTAFAEIARRCFAFVAPSCAEATSTACVTLLQLGLYPIVSRATGLDLPDGCGTYLETCTIDEIEEAVARTHAIDAATAREQLVATRAAALRDHSRERFDAAMRRYLGAALGC
jgi:glycosyltransferase involved in cell wall biosynthesis